MAMIQTFPTGSGNGSGGSITILGCFNTAPATFVQGDIYYNTTDGLIYTANSATTWDAGATPKKDILYISLDDHKIYSYTNNAFEIYGGNVEISKEPFNTLTEKSDGLYAEPKGLGAAYRKDTIIYDNSALNTVKTNDIIELSDDIINYDSLFICTGSDINSADTRKIHEIRLNDVDYVNDNQYKYGLDFCYNTTYYYSIRFKFIDSKHIKISSVIYGGWSGATIVQIVGTKYTTDVSQLVDSSKSIEDTPVGEIITRIGGKAPAHYLICDGSEYNILDYPELASAIEKEFGVVNVFGGDGVTTFAVPNYTVPLISILPAMSSNSQDGFIASASSIYSATYPEWKSFNKTNLDQNDGWATALGSTTGWLQIQMPKAKRVDKFSLTTRTGPASETTHFIDFELLGSSDGSTWDTIATITNEPTWGLNETRYYDVSSNNIYSYYRVNFSKTSNTPYVDVAEFDLYQYENQQFIKYEPTYYMELNQAAYINEYCEVYSTDEKIVGRWTDGKPVYRKVVPVTLPSGTNGTNTAHGISNMDTLVNYSLTWYDTLDGAWYDRFRLWEGSYGIAMEMNINGTYISIGSNRTNTINWTSRTSKAYATLEYTKTTDAPNSFDYGMIIDQFTQEALLDVAVTDAEVDRCFE